MFDRIFVDMDGVLADFDRHFIEVNKATPREIQDNLGNDEFWLQVWNDPDFFLNLKPMSCMDRVWELANTFSELPPIILSSPATTNRSLCEAQKRVWVNTHFGTKTPVLFEKEKFKYARPDRLLIDDFLKNTSKWEAAGGVAHLYTSIKELDNFFKQIQ